MILTNDISTIIFQNIVPENLDDRLSNVMIDYANEKFITVKLHTKIGETDYKGYNPIKIKRCVEEWEIDGTEIKNTKIHSFALIGETQDNTFSHYTVSIGDEEIASVSLTPLPVSQNISPEFKEGHIQIQY